MLLGTDTVAPKFQFRLPKKQENGPLQRGGGVGENFFSLKTLAVIIKCIMQMENLKYQTVRPKNPDTDTHTDAQIQMHTQTHTYTHSHTDTH